MLVCFYLFTTLRVQLVKLVNMKITKTHKRSGFTLIELLVVISIIGLLASVVLISLNSARQKSRDAKRIADVKQLATALELYFNDYGGYPPTSSVLAPGYVGQIPTAPTPVDGTCSVASNTYTYTQLGSGASYTYRFCLGATTGGFTAGGKTLSPAGIQ